MHPALTEIQSSKDFIEIQPSQTIAIDLKYATFDNFMGSNVYGEFRKAYLHREAFEKLMVAAAELEKQRPGHKLLILDALRPRSIQRVLWSKVVGTPSEKYVANPDGRGSMHNYGMAVDLTIIDADGRWLDMGAGFDDFREISQPSLEENFLRSGDLTRNQIANRELLRHCMFKAGFFGIGSEWWHFNAITRENLANGYTIIE